MHATSKPRWADLLEGPLVTIMGKLSRHPESLSNFRLVAKPWYLASRGFSGALVRKTDREVSLEVISRLFPCLTDLTFVTQNRVSLTLPSQFNQLTRLVLRDQQSGSPNLRADNFASLDSLPSTLQALELAGISLDRASSQDADFTNLTSLRWTWEETTATDDVCKLLQKLPGLKVRLYCYHLQCCHLQKDKIHRCCQSIHNQEVSLLGLS